MRAFSVVLALLALTATAEAKTLEVGEGKQYEKPSDAIREAADGDTVRIAPGSYFDCAVAKQNNLTIEGSGSPEQAVMTDSTCQGKALLVIGGSKVTIRNLTLTRARVPDGNGAGIRAEGGDLTVDHVRFVNNQNGILSIDNAPNMTITVTDSLFDKNGSCVAACAHGIYVGKIKLLKVENSVFSETKEAHSIKSRAIATEVIGTDIHDGPNGTSSYPIEVPNGGSLIVRDCKIEKGPKAENHKAAIMLGSEGIKQATPQILVENTTITNDGDYGTTLLTNLSATEAVLKHNKSKGSVKMLSGDGTVTD